MARKKAPVRSKVQKPTEYYLLFDAASDLVLTTDEHSIQSIVDGITNELIDFDPDGTLEIYKRVARVELEEINRYPEYKVTVKEIK